MGLLRDIRLVEQSLRQTGHPSAGGREYIFDCPLCKKAKKLYVNPKLWKFICYRCGKGGNVDFLLRKLGIEIDELLMPPTPFEDLRKRLSDLDRVGAEVSIKTPLPDDFWPIMAGTEPEEYLLKRGVTHEDMNFYAMGCGAGQTAGRIILPAFDDEGECVIWTARDYTNNSTLRYLTPKGADRRKWVPYLNLAKREKTVVVCEGMFSAVGAGRNAVATMGKLCSEEQKLKLLNANFEAYYIAYDGNALTESLKLAEYFYRWGRASFIVPLPFEEDPASVGKEVFQSILAKESIPFTQESALTLRIARL